MSSKSALVPVIGILTKDNTIEGYQLPLAFLTDLNEDQKNQLIEHLRCNAEQNGKPLTLHTWHPSPETLQSIAKPGPRLDSLFVNVGVANMGFDEFGDREKMGFFPRPGWPGHGVLVDADEGM
ncbi:hypothetical protein BJX66DRAFT_337508 [Aspergillus keveii]|uniref:Uncharacterized protein n=1 Tax=Aspergillus keveii TaxID=714993 RepID=A0ABR4G791_9EURO